MSSPVQSKVCVISLHITWSRWILLLAFLLQPPMAFGADFTVSRFREIDEIKRKVLASHFLMRTTFGPTEPDVDALAMRIKQIGKKAAFEEWIEGQFNDYPISSNWQAYEADRGRLWPLTKKMLNDMGYQARNFGIESSEPGGVRGRNYWKEHAWWHRSLTAKDQLRQRMAWALSQIFVVGEGAGEFQDRGLDASTHPRWLGLPRYYDDVCITHAFGNYRELIETVTYSPVMGIYLTHLNNRKANPETGIFPDENYARELMQLFSIGLVELKKNGEVRLGPDGEPIETYNNETITALARVFTGMVFDNGRDGTRFAGGLNLHAAMEVHEPEHDTDQKVAFQGRLVIPARPQSPANARQDIDDVLDFLAYEHENTGPFICRQLIQRLVMSNPPSYYLRRVVRAWDANKSNPRQLEEVIKAILLDRVALNTLRFKTVRSPRLALQVIRKYPTERTRLREPVLRYTAMLRVFSPYPDPGFQTNRENIAYYTPGGPEGEAGNQYFLLDNDYGIGASLGQAPYESESVFNFYRPDYQAPGPLANYVPSRSVVNGKIVTPEFQIISPVTTIRLMNHFRGITTVNHHPMGPKYEVDRSEDLYLNVDFSRFFEHGGTLGNVGDEPTESQLGDFLEELDLRLFAGTMSEKTKQAAMKACTNEMERSDVDTERTKEDMVQAVICVLLAAPDCAVIP